MAPALAAARNLASGIAKLESKQEAHGEDVARQLCELRAQLDELNAALDALGSLARLATLSRRSPVKLTDSAMQLLGIECRSIRDQAAVKRWELAELSAVSEKTIQNFEEGKHRLSPANLHKLATALLPLAERTRQPPERIADLRALLELLTPTEQAIKPDR